MADKNDEKTVVTPEAAEAKAEKITQASTITQPSRQMTA